MKRFFTKFFPSFARVERGFTLLIAALVAAIVLSIGAAIFDIAQKEIALSSIGRDSQFAFYAADTAAECALYWDVRSDIHPDTFATSSASHPAASVLCDGQTGTLSVSASNSTSATTQFSYAPNGYCADVSVVKTLNVSGAIQTVIRADGFSTTCANIDTDPQVLQRSVELQY